MQFQSIDLLQDRKTKKVTLLRMGVLRDNGVLIGGSTHHGAPLCYPEDNFRANCVALVKAGLADYDKPELLSQQGLNQMPIPERKKLFKGSKYVTLSVQENGSVSVDSMQYDTNPLMGYGPEEYRRFVKLNEIDDAGLWRVLESAFADAK